MEHMANNNEQNETDTITFPVHFFEEKKTDTASNNKLTLQKNTERFCSRHPNFDRRYENSFGHQKESLNWQHRCEE